MNSPDFPSSLVSRDAFVGAKASTVAEIVCLTERDGHTCSFEGVLSEWEIASEAIKLLRVNIGTNFYTDARYFQFAQVISSVQRICS